MTLVRGKLPGVNSIVFNVSMRARTNSFKTPDRVLDRKSTRRLFRSLKEVIEALQHDFGTWKVAWGELSRLQRIDESKNEQFQDSRPSLRSEEYTTPLPIS